MEETFDLSQKFAGIVGVDIIDGKCNGIKNAEGFHKSEVRNPKFKTNSNDQNTKIPKLNVLKIESFEF